jgi:hypothetical protein
MKGGWMTTTQIDFISHSGVVWVKFSGMQNKKSIRASVFFEKIY